MPNNKSKKESGKVILARVKKEMAEPRLARSVRDRGVERGGAPQRSKDPRVAGSAVIFRRK
jgi:hypothetical protein